MQVRHFIERIKTKVLALGRPLIEHRDAVMAVQWLVEKCRASGEIPVAFCIMVSRGCVHLLDFPHSPSTRRFLVPRFSSIRPVFSRLARRFDLSRRVRGFELR